MQLDGPKTLAPFLSATTAPLAASGPTTRMVIDLRSDSGAELPELSDTIVPSLARGRQPAQLRSRVRRFRVISISSSTTAALQIRAAS